MTPPMELSRWSESLHRDKGDEIIDKETFLASLSEWNVNWPITRKAKDQLWSQYSQDYLVPKVFARKPGRRTIYFSRAGRAQTRVIDEKTGRFVSSAEGVHREAGKAAGGAGAKRVSRGYRKGKPEKRVGSKSCKGHARKAISKKVKK